jgi:hypothetical protein
MEKVIVEYQLLSEATEHMLIEEVNNLLSEGWQPYGEPFVYKDDSGETWIDQAMVLYR